MVWYVSHEPSLFADLASHAGAHNGGYGVAQASQDEGSRQGWGWGGEPAAARDRQAVEVDRHGRVVASASNQLDRADASGLLLSQKKQSIADREATLKLRLQEVQHLFPGICAYTSCCLP